MIYPRLNRVRNGQRMSVELVNGLIKRTEYAADLLRQYKCVAGTDILVAQQYDGTIISSPAPEMEIYAVGIYYDPSIFDYKGFLYSIKEKTFAELVFDGFNNINPVGIQDGVIVGHCLNANGNLVGFKYFNGQLSTFSFNSDPSIRTYFTGIFDEQIVGYSEEPSPAPVVVLVNGFVFNGNEFTLINYETPEDFRVNTIPKGIYEKIIVGEHNNSNTERPFIPSKVGFRYDLDTSQFEILNPFGALSTPSANVRASGIYEDKIVGVIYNKFLPEQFAVGYIYDGASYETIIYPSKYYTEPTAIYKDIVVGFFANDSGFDQLPSFIYQNGEFETVQYEDSPETYIYGIGLLPKGVVS